LPCKVIEKCSNQTYKLQCKNGILDTTFSANELMPLGPTEYKELESCQSDIIGVREAAKKQSTSAITGIQCNCKGECKKNVCKCKRSNLPCGSSCHPHSSKCLNKE
jgi:hypothetical protein